MSRPAAVARTFLLALRNLGNEAEADAFERRFDQLVWNLGPEHLAELSEALQAAAAAPANDVDRVAQPQASSSLDSLLTARQLSMAVPRASEADQRSPSGSLSTPTDLRALSAFEPWADTLVRGWSLVRAVHRIVQSDSYSSFSGAIRDVFGGYLGFDAVSLDEADRLSTQTTLTRVHVVAKHGDFYIVTTESRYPGPYTTHLEPVLQLHPYCLAFEWNFTGRVRVFARSSRKDVPIITREMRGRTANPDDDLLVWSRRFSRLKPLASDDELSLSARARKAVGDAPAEVADDWASVAIDPQIVPGTAWHQQAQVERTRFLQPVKDQPRMFLGLEAVLRTNFPWISEARSKDEASVEIHFRNYEVVADTTSTEECAAAGGHSNARLLLYLEHRVTGRVAEHFTIRAAVPVPDDDGLFVLHGECLQFIPGAMTSRGDEPDDLEETGDDTPDIESPDEDELASDADSEQGSTPAGPERYQGASVEGLLVHVVGRKLRACAVQFSRVLPIRLASIGKVRAWLGRFTSAAHEFEIASIGGLRSHLRLFNGAPRVLSEDRADPPAWACLDASAVMRPGEFLPIAGARVAPAGLLAAPVVQSSGTLQLRICAESAVTANPRVSGRHVEQAGLFIAALLSPWAGLRPGAIAGVQDIMRGTAPCLPVLCTFSADDIPVLELDRARFSPVRKVRSWHFDVPSHRRANSRPRVLVDLGDWLEGGQAVLAISSSTWPACDSDRHNLHDVLRRIATSADEEESERDSEGTSEVLIRCPSSLRGRIVRIGLTQRRSRTGDLVGDRLTVAVSSAAWPTHAMLADGRRVDVRWTDASDMPFALETGAAAAGILRDPWMREDGTCDDAAWIDGTSGEAFGFGKTETGILLLAPAVESPPDGALQYRVLDGSGIPRSATDPMLTIGELRAMRAHSPESARVIDEAQRRAHGQTPIAKTLYELSIASHVAPPPVVPVDWLEVAPRFCAGSHDPKKTSATRPHAKAWDGTYGAPVIWACSCSALTGRRRALETCRACNSRVEQRTRVPVESWPAIALPLPVLHPWRRAFAAGLLGLLETELDEVIAHYQSTELTAHLEAAWSDPTRNLLSRLQRTKDKRTRDELCQSLFGLETAMRGTFQLESLWLHEVRILPLRLLFNGYPGGASTLMQSQLSGKYRAVSVMAKMLQDFTNSGVEPLRQASWIELQKRVIALFGAALQPQPDTLAALWTRVWPTTSPSELKISAPGLFMNCSHDEIRDSRASMAFTRTRLHPSSESQSYKIPAGVVLADRVVSLAHGIPATVRPVTDSQAWLERAAAHWLSDEAVTRLAGAILGMASLDAFWVHVSNDLPDALDRRAVGTFVLREFTTSLTQPDSRASALKALLIPQVRVTLPSEQAGAERKVFSIIADAMPSTTPAAALARNLLTVFLSGFWRIQRGPENPLGWFWSRGEHGVATGARRMFPRLSDRAWQLCPGFGAFTSPLTSAATGHWHELTEGHLSWLGGAPPNLPPSSAVTDTPKAVPFRPLSNAPPPSSVDEREQVPASNSNYALPAVEEVTVFAGPLQPWLEAHILGGSDDS